MERAPDIPSPGRPERPAVYLAGPDGFTEAGLAWHREVLVPAVRAAGLVPLSPWEALVPEPAAPVGDAGPADGPGPAGLAAPAGDGGEPPHEGEAAAGDPAARREAALRIGAANAELIEGCDAVLAVLDGADVDSGTAAEIGYAARAGRPVVGLRTDRRRSGDGEGVEINLQVEHFIVASGGSIHHHLDRALTELVRLAGRQA